MLKKNNILYTAFDAIIVAGRTCFSIEKERSESINETIFLKKDLNYYSIISLEWDVLKPKIDSIFNKLTF